MALRVLWGSRATVPLLLGTLGLMWGWVYLFRVKWELAGYALLLLAPLTGFAVAKGMQFRRRALVALLAASPLVVKPMQWALYAAADYHRGKATIVEHRGFHYAEPYANIDARTRIPVRTIATGCMGPRLDAYVIHGVGNLTLRALTWVFGPMDRVYTGPLPTEIQWRRRLAEEGLPDDKRADEDADVVSERRVYHEAGLEAHQVCERIENEQHIRCRIRVFDIRTHAEALGTFVHSAEPFDRL